MYCSLYIVFTPKKNTILKKAYSTQHLGPKTANKLQSIYTKLNEPMETSLLSIPQPTGFTSTVCVLSLQGNYPQSIKIFISK